MTEAVQHIVCPHCDTVNRVPASKAAREAKCGRCHKMLFTGAPAAISAQGFQKQIQKSDIPVVVDFWADWCGPCHMMAPVFARATAEFEPHVRFLKLDIEAAPEIAARYDVRSIPMLALFRNGAVVAQRAGAVDDRALRAWLRQHVELPAAA